MKNGKIFEKAKHSLVPLSPIAGRFYLLPKIHKPGNPGRPIVSGIGTVTEPLSCYVDSLIHNIPPTFSSYLKDTNHFLTDIIDLDIPDGSLLVTMDVTSLYTNIPHEDGIHAVLDAYDNLPFAKQVDTPTLGMLLKLILQLNNFEFNGDHFVQVSGTSMGTKIGPNYANIFMGALEEKFLGTCSLKPYYYKRYIDDIFLIWHHGESQLLSFVTAFNSVHPSISFTESYSTSTINFLDVTVSLSGTKLTTKLYRKPTDRHQYLHFRSSHTRHCKTSIPYSQALRYRKICSNDADFIDNCRKLRNALTRQKYPLQIIDDAIKRASAIDRNEILRSDNRVKQPPSPTLVLTHCASVPSVHGILRKHHNILMQSSRLTQIFPQPPRVAYRRSRNLRDMLTTSKTTSTRPSGCHPCQKPRCKVCAHMTTATVAASTASDFFCKIKGNFSCDSSNVIYLVECGVCKLQYIGQTETPFRVRFNNHKSHTKSLPNLPLSKHVAIPGHSFENIAATILESGFKSHREREVRESFLIFKFKALTSGLNENPGKISFL